MRKVKVLVGLVLMLIGGSIGWKCLHSSSKGVLVESYGDDIGQVRLPISYGNQVDRHLERGLGLLHSMTYQGARKEFQAAEKKDPACLFAIWGQLMTLVHPLWSDPPDEKSFKDGETLLDRASQLRPHSAREQAYMDAVKAYFLVGKQSSEKANLLAFEEGWQKAYEAFPDDVEVMAFYALAHLATADPTDKSYTKQRQAGSLAEAVLKKEPRHPGGHHYAIHAYDYPELAHLAEDIARTYSRIAPEVPHALHMPSHIFTRLGLWRECAELNMRSAAAALNHPVDGAISLHYPHALDYLVYAYLQLDDVAAAKNVLVQLESQKMAYQTHFASAYALAAIPARLAIERKDWQEAAALTPRSPSSFEWDLFPAAEALSYFAIALGSAYGGDEAKVGSALQQLLALRDKTAQSSPYWANQIHILHLCALGCLQQQLGKGEMARQTLQQAVAAEAITEKHPVTPGELLPARELLADVLMKQQRYGEALQEYRLSLERSSRRLNSLYGAGRAAELTGDRVTATAYYRQLVSMASIESQREEVQHARLFLEE